MGGSTFLVSTATDEALLVTCYFLWVGICSYACLLLNRRRRRRCRCRRWYIADASRIPPLRSGPRGEWDSLGASILTALQVRMHLPQFPINLLRSAQQQRCGSSAGVWLPRAAILPTHFPQGAPSGRLLRYDPRTRTTELLADGIWFANGVALAGEQAGAVGAGKGTALLCGWRLAAGVMPCSQQGVAAPSLGPPLSLPAQLRSVGLALWACAEDESYVLVVETFGCRVLRHWLEGPQAGTTDVSVQQQRMRGGPAHITVWALLHGPARLAGGAQPVVLLTRCASAGCSYPHRRCFWRGCPASQTASRVRQVAAATGLPSSPPPQVSPPVSDATQWAVSLDASLSTACCQSLQAYAADSLAPLFSICRGGQAAPDLAPPAMGGGLAA
jgi:hypothetical protein